MSERLIPFDWEAFVKDPMRVRHRDGQAPKFRPEVALRDCVAVQWVTSPVPSIYDRYNATMFLRLVAPEPQRVKVRLYRTDSGAIIPAVCSLTDGAGPWCSDIVEIEVRE